MKPVSPFKSRFIQWVIDGITFITVILLILTAYSYTKSYVHVRRRIETDEVKTVSKIKAAAPYLARYMESEDRTVVLFFIDFSCPKCAKFWEKVTDYLPRLSDRYRFILVPESTDTPVPVADIFIDRLGAVKRILHLSSSPSAVIIDPLSYNIEIIDMPHRIIAWLQRMSASRTPRPGKKPDGEGGDEKFGYIIK